MLKLNIRLNVLFYVIFILIVKKLNKKFKLYINYRVFNIFIVFNRNALSLIKKTLIKLYITRLYNKFDIVFIFNKIRMKFFFEKKIIFFIKIEFYKYIIMSFDLYNVFITF